MNYLLLGTESYNIHARCQALILENLGAVDDINVTKYRDNEAVSVQQVIEDCQTVPFGGSCKIIIWYNPVFLTGAKSAENEAEGQQLINYLNNPNGTTILVICGGGEVDRRRKLVLELHKLMKTEIYDELLPEEFRQLVGQDLNAAGLKIDKKAFDMLVSRLPISVGNWKQELEKLKLYPGKLDQAAVKALICKPLENDIFELSKAIVNHDVNRAMTIYQDLTIIAKTDPASLMGLVAYQFRFMCQVQNLAEHNYSISAIADQLGCKSYRVTMTLQSAVGMSTMDLLQILDRMAKLDKDIKTGNVDKQAGMELFILDMARRTPVWNH